MRIRAVCSLLVKRRLKLALLQRYVRFFIAVKRSFVMSERPDTEPLPDDAEIPAYEDDDTDQ